jgi:hypothetical protein
MPDPTTEKPCPKCGLWKVTSDFEGRKYCAACREYARTAMKRHHDRKRLGVSAVSKGRPSVNALENAVRMTITIPRPLVGQVEEYLATIVTAYIRENVDQNYAGPLPPSFQFGEKLNQPLEPRAKPPISRSSKRGARSAEDQTFLDHCKPHIAESLETVSAPIFDLRRKQWEAQGKPTDWSPPSRKDREALKTPTAPEGSPAQPTADQDGPTTG